MMTSCAPSPPNALKQRHRRHRRAALSTRSAGSRFGDHAHVASRAVVRGRAVSDATPAAPGRRSARALRRTGTTSPPDRATEVPRRRRSEAKVARPARPFRRMITQRPVIGVAPQLRHQRYQPGRNASSITVTRGGRLRSRSPTTSKRHGDVVAGCAAPGSRSAIHTMRCCFCDVTASDGSPKLPSGLAFTSTNTVYSPCLRDDVDLAVRGAVTPRRRWHIRAVRAPRRRGLRRRLPSRLAGA